MPQEALSRAPVNGWETGPGFHSPMRGGWSSTLSLADYGWASPMGQLPLYIDPCLRRLQAVTGIFYLLAIRV